jgi:hypothetical protein
VGDAEGVVAGVQGARDGHGIGVPADVCERAGAGGPAPSMIISGISRPQIVEPAMASPARQPH